MLSPASPPGPALGPALREGLKLGPGPSPTFKARARPELVFLGPDPSLDAIVFYGGAKGSLQKQNQIDLTEMKQFKESNNIIEQMNQGIKPKIILFMPVRNKTRFH